MKTLAEPTERNPAPDQDAGFDPPTPLDSAVLPTPDPMKPTSIVHPFVQTPQRHARSLIALALVALFLAAAPIPGFATTASFLGVNTPAKP